MQFNQLVEEVLQEDYLEEVNWKALGAAAALGGASLLPSTAKAQSVQQPPVTQQSVKSGYTAYSPALATPEAKQIYDSIINSDKAIPVTKEQLIRATLPQDAETYLKAMTPLQKQTQVYVYGPKMADKLSANYPKIGAVLAAYPAFTEYRSKTPYIVVGKQCLDWSQQEFLDMLKHEMQHAADKLQYPLGKPDFDNKKLGFMDTAGSRNDPRNIPVAKFTADASPSQIQHMSPLEIRGEIAGSRDYFGVVRTPQEFKQKWDDAVKIFDEIKNPFDSFKTNSKLPQQLRLLIYMYKIKASSPQAQQELYNYIQRTVLDNSVAINKANTNTRVV